MNKTGSWIFLCGMATGALVGILYAPQRGVRTRRRINAKAKQAQRVLAEQSAEVREQLSVGAGQARERLRRSASGVKRALHR